MKEEQRRWRSELKTEEYERHFRTIEDERYSATMNRTFFYYCPFARRTSSLLM